MAAAPGVRDLLNNAIRGFGKECARQFDQATLRGVLADFDAEVVQTIPDQLPVATVAQEFVRACMRRRTLDPSLFDILWDERPVGPWAEHHRNLSTVMRTRRAARTVCVLEANGLAVRAIPGLTIGRSRGCSVILLDPKVSRRHATVVDLGGGQLELVASGEHGLMVHGEMVRRTRLRDDIAFTIGQTRFRCRGASLSDWHTDGEAPTEIIYGFHDPNAGQDLAEKFCIWLSNVKSAHGSDLLHDVLLRHESNELVQPLMLVSTGGEPKVLSLRLIHYAHGRPGILSLLRSVATDILEPLKVSRPGFAERMLALLEGAIPDLWE